MKWNLCKWMILGAVMLTVTACFPHRAGPRLSHFYDQAPRVGDSAPDFRLTDLAGEEVRLQELLGDKPLVLQFGSHSCPVYRYRRFGMHDLHAKYAGRVNFQIVYTIEAHPAGSKSPYSEGEWISFPNKLTGTYVPQAQTRAQRASTARRSTIDLELEIPVAIDGLDNTAWQTWGAASSPGFIINRDGKVVLRQVWLDPKEMDTVLSTLVEEDG